MDRGLYVSMTGAREALLSQDTHANNLANTGTTGFKSDYQQFRSMPVFGSFYPTRVYSQSERPASNVHGGASIPTGRSLDVAVQEDGWIAVQDADGKEAYTRSGNLDRLADGSLVTGDGFKVIGNGGPIKMPEFENLEIGQDGTIGIRSLGEGPLGLVVVDKIKLVKPGEDGWNKGPDGLFRVPDGTPQPVNTQVRLMGGTLESSNVNTVGELASIITSSRLMEMNLKMMSTYKEDDQSAARIMQG